MSQACPAPEILAAEAVATAGPSPALQAHLESCPACAHRAAALKRLETLLPAAFADETEIPVPALPRTREALRQAAGTPGLHPRTWAWAAAALVMVSGAAAWRFRETPSESLPAAALSIPAGPVTLAAGAWFSGSGITAVLAPGGKAEALPSASGAVMTLAQGSLWIENPLGAACTVRTSEGILTLLEGTAWVELETDSLQDGLVREARAASGTVRLALRSGRATWEGGSRREPMAPGELLTWTPAGPSRSPMPPERWIALESASRDAVEASWIDLLAPQERARLQASAPLAALREGGLSLANPGELASVTADLPRLSGQAYVMELRCRISGERSRAAMAYPAGGRLPLADLAPGAWQTLRIVHAAGGTEIWLDGTCRRRLTPDALARSPLREHALQRPGLILWHGGQIEIRSWRLRLLNP